MIAGARLNAGQAVTALAGATLLALMFAPWFSLPQGAGVSAWKAFGVGDILLAIAALTPVAMAVVALTRLSVSLPIAGNAIGGLIALIAFVYVVVRLLDPVERAGVELERDWGLYAGLAAVLVVFVASYRGMQEDPAPLATPGG